MFSKQVSLKIQSQGKIKRIRDMPSNFQALKAVVEAQLADESAGPVKPTSQPRNYTIKYQDASQDWINVSDDEDVLTSIDVAQKELQGTLKYVVAFKQQALEEPPKAAKKAKKAGGKKKKAEEDLQRAATTVQPQHIEEPEEETPSSAEEEKDDSHTDKPKKVSKKGSKLPPRNALKKLISKELEQAAPLIFAELAKIKDLT